ncbi:MAG: hypothetical protein HZA67_10910 [Rhodospirillales bacterium]|nr:hypothetical protein [Rhodospirillales bacterium]
MALSLGNMDNQTLPPSSQATVDRMEEEAFMALDFACRKGLATQEIIDLAESIEEPGMRANDEARLARVRQMTNRLAQMIAPATFDGIKLVNEMGRRHQSAKSVAWQQKFFSLFRKIEFGGYGILSFLVLMYFQIFTGSASYAVATYERALTEYGATLSEISRLKLAEGDKFDEDKYEDLFRGKELKAGRLASASQIIETISFYELPIFTKKDNKNGGALSAPAKSNNAHTSLHHSVEILSKYVLPLLYGLLGACTFIIRQLTQRMDDASFKRTTLYQYRFRLLLGMVLGGIVSLFLSPEAMNGLNLSLSAIAFLAGYGVEAVFKALDSLVEKMRRAAAGDEGKKGAAGAGGSP